MKSGLSRPRLRPQRLDYRKRPACGEGDQHQRLKYSIKIHLHLPMYSIVVNRICKTPVSQTIPAKRTYIFPFPYPSGAQRRRLAVATVPLSAFAYAIAATWKQGPCELFPRYCPCRRRHRWPPEPSCMRRHHRILAGLGRESRHACRHRLVLTHHST